MPSARRRHFCILLLPDKSMASGGTRPAGFVFQKSNKDNRLTICCPLYHDLWLNFVSSLRTNSRLPFNTYQTQPGGGLLRCRIKEPDGFFLVPTLIPHAALVAYAFRPRLDPHRNSAGRGLAIPVISIKLRGLFGPMLPTRRTTCQEQKQ